MTKATKQPTKTTHTRQPAKAKAAIPTTSESQYDLIIFGATSFVGAILTRYIAAQFGLNKELKWAIAGRSEIKLQKVRGTLVKALGDDAKNVPMLIADAANEAQLRDLCAKTNVIVSTVGPYALYGEPLVKVCAETGTDYCDLTGEPQWIKRMLEKYEAKAKASGARIVHCCGFDSVPSDMGVYFLQQQAEQEFGCVAPSVKMRVNAAKGGMSGGTVASIVNLTKEYIANPSLRKELADPYSICPPGHRFSTKQVDQRGAKFDSQFKAWSAPFIMAAINTRVVHRSNALLGKKYGNDFTYEETMLTGRGAKGRAMATGITLGLGAFMAGAAIKPTRWLLERFVLPKPGQGPSPKAQEAGFYDIRFAGLTKDGRKILTRVTGDMDPGYGSTGKLLGQAAAGLALDFHKDGKKCDKEGGFWTPGSIFDQRYIDRLQDFAGVTFEVLEK
ncbi:saccharopine dehydrogenase family protein [Thalassolituus sp.]|uniref:saccharopine dehydrogenase family protein n=1 Tax=Thalassolituus sp. TaxID=2030822 RepID=UPI002A80CB42|nr:saccharopine dehydrogenase NADP-binding domain-containing protein [Thalassolituus sp.]